MMGVTVHSFSWRENVILTFNKVYKYLFVIVRLKVLPDH